LWRANPYAGNRLSISSQIRSRVTLATIEAAAMDELMASPSMIARCG
jgi:hypothetical protein